MNVYKYVGRYGFPNYQEKDFNRLYQELVDDFIIEYASGPYQFDKIPFSSLKKAVTELLKVIAVLGNMSGGKFNPDLVWRSIFWTKIAEITIARYPSALDDSFFELAKHFRTKKKKPEAKPITEDEYIQFMGLTAGFTKRDLTKRYRQLCLIYHPDKGGSEKMFLKLQRCKEELNKRL